VRKGREVSERAARWERRKMEYQDLKNGIRNHLDSAAEDFFMVGYFLRQISESTLFTEDGYKNIWEFAKGEYGLSASSASRFMAINARFSIDGGEHMAERYIGLGVSKLQEMLGLPDEELERVTQETTVKEIRAMKKKQEEALSFHGLPKTVYPEDSFLTTPGCGDGKYSCFLCACSCSIRQQERYCRTATCGTPFPCTQMGEEKRKTIEDGVYGDKCQFLHPELALVTERNQEPDPCCLNCRYRLCYYRCDVARKRDIERQEKPENADTSCDVATEQNENKKKRVPATVQEQMRKELQEVEKRTVAEYASEEQHEEPTEEELMEAEFREVEERQQEPEAMLCDTCEHDSECFGKKTHANGCMGYEEMLEPDGMEKTGAEQESDPEQYTDGDVRRLFNQCKNDLKEYKRLKGPFLIIQRQRIYVDALELLLAKWGEECEKETEEEEMLPGQMSLEELIG
jgi:hypothetical protein